MYIKKAVPASKNRIRYDFNDAIHVIENLTITENMVTAYIRSYASLESYNYNENPSLESHVPERNDGRQINERHESFARKSLDLSEVVSTDPYEQIKEASYKYIVENSEELKGGVIVNE